MKNTVKILMVIAVLLSSCDRSFLDLKPDRSQSVPSTMQDLRAILDNYLLINSPSAFGLVEMSSDDYFVEPSVLAQINRPEQINAYKWMPDIYEHVENIQDWNAPYQRVLYANIVLERLRAIERSTNPVEFDAILGSAYFIRGWAFWELYNTFGQLYDKNTWGKDLGIPLRLESDITTPSTRNTVQQTLEQIEKDFVQSISLLPNLAQQKSRPSKLAAYAFLSRLYLFLERYDEAQHMASETLAIYDRLLNYNEQVFSGTYPFQKDNDEVIFQSQMTTHAILNRSRLLVSEDLLDLYCETDRRLELFFDDSALGTRYRGAYTGSASFFTGLATDEVWLNQIEALAHLDDFDKSKAKLKSFIDKRHSEKISFTINSKEQLLDYIRKERRRQLVFRGIRLMDLKRYNRNESTEVELRRLVNNTSYDLKPNSNKYVMPIPTEVIRISKISQNNRDEN